jgi:hypothetical protein
VGHFKMQLSEQTAKKIFLRALLLAEVVIGKVLYAEDVSYTKSLDRDFLLQGSYANVSYGESEIAGFGFHFSTGLFLTPKLYGSIGYLSMADATGSTVLNGFDAAFKWYLLTPGSGIKTRGEGKQVMTYTEWNHYFLLGYRLRTLAAEVNTPQYSGFGYGTGINWFFGRTFDVTWLKSFFCNFEIDTGKLTSPQGGTSRSTNLSVGLGTTF